MGPITLAAVYFIIWWMTLFMVLPFGVQPQGDSSEGHEAGAPVKPRIILKMVINSVIAGVLWGIVYAIDRYDLVQLRRP